MGPGTRGRSLAPTLADEDAEVVLELAPDELELDELGLLEAAAVELVDEAVVAALAEALARACCRSARRSSLLGPIDDQITAKVIAATIKKIVPAQSSLVCGRGIAIESPLPVGVLPHHKPHRRYAARKWDNRVLMSATLHAAPATPAPTAVLPPLQIGRLTIPSPVVLAPMAGITNRAFRRLCRGYAGAGGSGDGALYVSEMITSRALVERNALTMKLIEHDPDESPRSTQLYSVDPATTAAAVRILVSEDRADHIDLNFGCPVPKVTRKGGGGALPWKRELFGAIVSAAVREASPYDVPVTVKMRVGIDADHLTYLDAGRIAEQRGAAAVALHARTVAQAYSGDADWSRIARLKEHVRSIPVLGNGDIWSAEDAVRMVRETGCDGVVVGRGCLGRPWLFADLAAAFAGRPERATPSLGEVTATLRRHAAYLVDFYDDELKGCRDIRKHIAWYLKGFPAGSQIRSQLALVDSLAAVDALIAELDAQAPWPGAAAEGQRGRAGNPRHVVLPEGWLDSPELTPAQTALVAEAEDNVSGG